MRMRRIQDSGREGNETGRRRRRRKTTTRSKGENEGERERPGGKRGESLRRNRVMPEET